MKTTTLLYYLLASACMALAGYSADEDYRPGHASGYGGGGERTATARLTRLEFLAADNPGLLVPGSWGQEH